MPFLDRTNEFGAIVASKLQETNLSKGNIEAPLSKTKNLTKRKSEFYTRASQISNELQKTTDILHKLTKCNEKITCVLTLQ